MSECSKWVRFALVLAAAGLVGAHGANAQAPTRTAAAVGAGTRWETRCYTVEAPAPGPTVVIVGGVHGDEPAGAQAADEIRRWTIARGRLIVLPRANPAALAAGKRLTPAAPAAEANLNRDFPRPGGPEKPVGAAAEGLWAWLKATGASWVIDLHEGVGTRAAGSDSVGSSAIAIDDAEAKLGADAAIAAVNATITVPKQRFVRLVPPVQGSLVRAAAEFMHAHALILETSIHDQASAGGKAEQPLSLRNRQHRLMVAALLGRLGMLPADFSVDRFPSGGDTPAPTAVALYDARGTGGRGADCVERILGRTMRVVRVGAEELANGALADFQVLLVPGGSSSAESAAIGPQGRKQVEQFVRNGGGYVGICAGAYLCTSGFRWSLHLIDAKTRSPLWRRGMDTVQMELTDAGRAVLGDRPGRLPIHYASGPIIEPAGIANLPRYTVWASFRTELAKNGTPPGIMVGAPAIASAAYGEGRVVLISPHPEQTPALEDCVLRAAAWAAAGQAPLQKPASLDHAWREALSDR